MSLQTTRPSVEGVWLSKDMRLPTCNGSSSELGLNLNAMASIDGFLVPSLIATKSLTLSGVPIIGNVMDEPVRWRNITADLDETNPVALPLALQGAVVQLRIAMKAAHLYSFRFECISRAGMH